MKQEERAGEAADRNEAISLDCGTLSWNDQYKLISSTVIPRPIALVTTDGPAGPNAAPFSFFNAIALGPPMLMFSIGPTQFAKKGELKDTLVNIRASGEFVVHLVDDANLEKMNLCCPEHDAGVSEIDLAGFRTAPSVKVRPPRLIELPVQFECVTHQLLELGNTPYHVVIGEIVQAHFHKRVVDDRYHVDIGALDPIGRLANPGIYSRVTDRFQLMAPHPDSPQPPSRTPLRTAAGE